MPCHAITKKELKQSNGEEQKKMNNINISKEPICYAASRTLQICLFSAECAEFRVYVERCAAHRHVPDRSALSHATRSQAESSQKAKQNKFKRMKWLNKGMPMHFPYHSFCWASTFSGKLKSGTDWFFRFQFFRAHFLVPVIFFSPFMSLRCVLILRLFFAGILFISHRCPFLLCDHVIGRVHFKSLPH